MPRSIDAPRNARSRRTRDALLSATRTVLEGEGFEALTMAEVAARAGVSRRAVYLHFRSRTDLVSALFDYIAAEEGLEESLRPMREATDAVTALYEWVRHLTRYHPRVLAVDQAIERVRRADPDAQRHRDVVVEAQLANCRFVVEWLHEDGRLAAGWDVETAVDLLFGLICTELFERLLELRGWSTDDLERSLWAMCRATLVRPDPDLR